MDKEVVVACYEEDIRWTRGLPATIYNKGRVSGGVRLPNVGREAHTYLHHILTRWETLADWTLFTQGNPDDHFPHPFDVAELLDGDDKKVRGALVVGRCREWDMKTGRLVHRNHWKEKIESGVICKSRWTMAEWFAVFIGMNLIPQPGLLYFPGAILGIPKDKILEKGKEFWQAIMDTMTHHANPEEAYYMERAWLYALNPPVDIDSVWIGLPNNKGKMEIFAHGSLGAHAEHGLGHEEKGEVLCTS